MLESLRHFVEINRAIVGTLDYDEVLWLLMEKTTAFTAADSCVLLLAGPDGLARVVASSGVDEAEARSFAAPLDERINVALRDLLRSREHDTFIGVPVFERGGIKGVLAIYRRGRDRPLPDEEFLLSALADQAAIALEHAERHRELLRASAGKSRLLEAIQAHTATALAYLDRELIFQEANASFSRFAGLPREAIVGCSHREVVTYGDLTAQLEQVVLSGKPAEVLELPAGGRAGEHWDWYARAICGERGLVEGLVISAIEVTEKVQARRALQEETQRKDDFLAMLSHELRNPLMPIRSSLYVLERTPPGGQQARRVREIMDRQVSHMARLIDDLLDITRISRGKIQLQLKQVELGAVIKEAVQDHQAAFGSAEVELEVELPLQPLWLRADATRIAQVVGNLLTNALKFTSAGGHVRLVVEHEVEHQAQPTRAVLRIQDTGVGIAPDMLQRVFAAFSQVDNTLDRSQGGLGLGLALVKGLTELHGGSVEAQSEGLGKGAEFIVHLPLDPKGRAATAAEGQPLAQVKGCRVLIIEDNIDSALSLQLLLELEGHQVHVAYSGQQGIEEAQYFRPQLVLCDIGLPEMDGYQVAQHLRAQARSDAMLVAVTGYARPEDIQRSEEAGFDRHLAKPPSIAAIRQLLADLPAETSSSSSPA